VKNKVDSFWQWVERRMEELEISSFRQLEKKAGFSPGAIGKRKNEIKPPTVEMAEGLCQALRVDWLELWTQAGYIQPLPATSDLQGLDAEIYLALSGKDDEFKRAFLKIIKILLSITPPP
jgi:transcriptional regulator with XRE-family HTH domain